MTLSTKLKMAALAISIAMVGTSASASSFFDGTFSEGASAGSFTTYNSGTSFGPWKSVMNSNSRGAPTSVDLIGSDWTAPGGYSVDLNGTNPYYGGTNSQAQGGIAQTFMASAGTYILTFDLAANDQGGTINPQVQVLLGSFSDIYMATTSASSGPWITETATITLTGGSNTIQFLSDYSGGPAGAQGNNFGPVVADVTLTATPLPSTWTMLIGGFAGLGFFAYRGSKKKVAALSAA
jgi:hypothetical protein